MSKDLDNVGALDFIPNPQSYDEYQQELKASQHGLSKDEVFRQMLQTSEAATDLDNLPAQDHNWVDRGQIMSCEGAGHPNHRHRKFNRGRRMVRQ